MTKLILRNILLITPKIHYARTKSKVSPSTSPGQIRIWNTSKGISTIIISQGKTKREPASPNLGAKVQADILKIRKVSDISKHRVEISTNGASKMWGFHTINF